MMLGEGDGGRGGYVGGSGGRGGGGAEQELDPTLLLVPLGQAKQDSWYKARAPTGENGSWVAMLDFGKQLLAATPGTSCVVTTKPTHPTQFKHMEAQASEPETTCPDEQMSFPLASFELRY